MLLCLCFKINSLHPNHLLYSYNTGENEQGEASNDKLVVTNYSGKKHGVIYLRRTL